MDLSCRICGGKERYHCPKKLQVHYKKNHSKMTLRCDICYNFFSKESELKGHRIEVHSDQEPYRCDHCEKGFADFEGILSHSMAKHKDIKKICGLCGNAYDSGQHPNECNKLNKNN